MKERLKKSLENIRLSEVKIFAKSLGIETRIKGTNKDRPKSSIVTDIVSYVAEKKEYDKLRDFYSKGGLLFAPISYKKANNFLNIECIDSLHEVPKKYGKIFFQKDENLFLKPSYFIPKNEDFIILFKKYANNKLAPLRVFKEIKTIFKVDAEFVLEKDFYYKIFKSFTKNSTRYTLSENIYFDYVSHKYQDKHITVTSRLSFESEPTKQLNLTIPKTSESINYSIKDKKIEELSHILNIPNTNYNKIHSCGINLYLSKESVTARYAVILNSQEFRIANIDTTLEDIVNVVKAFKKIHKKMY